MPNRLADATSPYLLQHADNPVDWHPWGEEALALARREDRPILLSIGYSACHWCHVMAHESFEDSATAAVMNRHFVNIKVDREERPDLDHIYQLAHQLLQQRAGGWPLTVFLTPDGMPFFSGTYFPRRPRYGLPGFVELLEHVTGVFANRRPEIEQQNASMRAALMPPRDAPAAAPCLDEAPVAHATALLARSFDREWGGFGGAPKFPRAPDLALLLRDEDPAHRLRAIDTLRHMAVGGIYDQLGGGFCRYSVDERWEIPHFEKMLYDNALLLPLYADAWAMTGETRFREVVEQTAAWVMREMQSPAGGYYSSLDADAEGEEGRFYVWTPDQASAALSPAEYAVFAPRYGLDRPPNFEGHAWHLRIVRSPESIAKSAGLSVATVESLLASACARLLQVREERVRPGRDDKVLAAWNALMIEGMAHAAKILDRRDWLASAERALQDLCDTLWCDGRLLATAKDGHAHLNAYLDDHAFLLAALIELLQARYRHQDVELARQVADTLLLRFEDRDAGGFHFTSHDHEILIARPKHAHDNALPSGNGVAARALAHLAAITGEMRYADAARRVLECFWPELSVAPAGSTALLQALREFCVPPQVVVLRGPAAQLPDWQKYVSCRFPALLLFAVPNGEDEVPAGLAKSEAPTVNAWVCSGVNCLQPVAQVESLAALLGGQM